jgi:hypothetical protein
MAENHRFKELLRLLNESEARYLIVGGYAIMKYSEPHYTKDLDVWVENSAENSASRSHHQKIASVTWLLPLEPRDTHELAGSALPHTTGREHSI